MNKVLIISYFFPPCNLTASNRAFFWAKNLKDYGYEPIVITRKWDHKIKSPKDIAYSSNNKKKLVEIKPNFSVIYMPYKGSIRDKIYVKKPSWKLLRKILTLLELFGNNYSAKVLPYYNILEEARLIIEEKNIKKVLITGNPFPCFQFGYLLKKKFKDLNWIADYRDDWTTTELYSPKGIVEKLLFKLEQKSEKKWVGSASFITSISNYYVEKISHFVNVKGIELINGFDEITEKPSNYNVAKDCFIITYNGSLYPSQKIEPVLEVINDLILYYRDKLHIEIKFPGLDFDTKQGDRIRIALKDVMKNVTITKRIDRNKVLQMQRESNLLLMISHEGKKGISSSKLYEYIGMQKPILLFPSDKDIIEKTLNDTGLGIICNTKQELKEKLNSLILDFTKTGNIPLMGNYERIKRYSRRIQVENLSKILDKI